MLMISCHGEGCTKARGRRGGRGGGGGGGGGDARQGRKTFDG